VTSLALNQPLPLTDEPFGVWDYALAPDGVTVAYTALRDDGGTDLFRIGTDGGNRAPLLSVAEAGGSAPAWSPDGTRIVYERRDLTLNATIVLPSLWWLDVETGETAPLFQDSALPGIRARWSPDGEWISYVRQGDAEVEIYHLQDGRRHTVSSQTGQPVMWGPRGDTLLVTDMRPAGKRHLTHLLRFDMTDETLVDLSGEAQVADMGAAWSPDGQWLSVVRKVYEDPPKITGNQIWLMRPDGSQARPLTQDPDAHYGAPVWSPDGKYLLVDRYPLKVSVAQSELWLLEVEPGTSRPVIAPGAQATWLP
jgi:TolB protein